MAYYSTFRLTCSGIDAVKEAGNIEAALKECGILHSTLDDYYTNNGDVIFPEYDWTVWSRCDEQMLEVSRGFPHILFSLYTDGEGADDYWMTYYKNGKTYTDTGEIEIKFPKYDESKLKGAMDNG